MLEIAQVYVDKLRSWRENLSPELAWKDNNPLSVNITIAQMRALYYEVFKLVRQPFLQAVVHQTGISKENILNLANDCILGAIQSIVAFDRIGADLDRKYVPYMIEEKKRRRRLIVTNIFGTLHV